MNEVLFRLRRTVAQGNWGYHATSPPAAEPAACACLALCANGFVDEASRLATWLTEIQVRAGSVGVTQEQSSPAWPTSLAMLAWHTCDQASTKTRFSGALERALDWALRTEGEAAPQQAHIGHDTTLIGWSWAIDTHSWLEPTCLFVVALKAIGHSKHWRTREAVRLIIDRLIASGGCNFGNTKVLGQATLPHVQPTGLAMLSIADEKSTDARIERSLRYLENALMNRTGTASLSFALLGLAAHKRRPRNAEVLLQRALASEDVDAPSCYKLALIALAGSDNLIWLPRVDPNIATSVAHHQESPTAP